MSKNDTTSVFWNSFVFGCFVFAFVFVLIFSFFFFSLRSWLVTYTVSIKSYGMMDWLLFKLRKNENNADMQIYQN